MVPSSSVGNRRAAPHHPGGRATRDRESRWHRRPRWHL